MTATTDTKIASLDTRVTNIEGSLDKIGSSIDKIGDKLDERSRPQWILIVAALGLTVTILGLVLAGWKAPLDGTIQRQEYDLRQLQQGVVPRVEHEYHWKSGEAADAEAASPGAARGGRLRSEAMSKRDTHSWDAAVRVWPSAIAVAMLVDSHGYGAAIERWGWISSRTLVSLRRQGQRQLERRAAAKSGAAKVS